MQTHSGDVRELIAAVDKKGTGYIGYDDFEAVMARSMLQHTRPLDAAVDLSGTIRLQPDTSALPFHEVLHHAQQVALVWSLLGLGIPLVYAAEHATCSKGMVCLRCIP